jgi:hypothetical protein
VKATEQNMCKTEFITTQNMQGSVTTTRYSMVSPEGDGTLPLNYYCRWEHEFDTNYAYIVFIKRSQERNERLELELLSENDEVKRVYDSDLISKEKRQ